MSNYDDPAASMLTPVQELLVMQQLVEKEQRTYRNHLTTKGVPGDPMFPGFKDVTKEYPGTLNYFNNTEPKEKSRVMTSYDSIFHQDFGYDPKRARSDRNATVGLDIDGQERKRIVHVAANSEYSRRIGDLEKLEPKAIRTQFGHYNIAEKEFYRMNNSGIPLKVDDGAQVYKP